MRSYRSVGRRISNCNLRQRLFIIPPEAYIKINKSTAKRKKRNKFGSVNRALTTGRKRRRMPFGRSTGKHKIANNILHGSPSRYRCTASPGIAARPNSPFISLKYFLSTFAIVSAVVLKRQLSSGTPGIFMRASLPKPHIS